MVKKRITFHLLLWGILLSYSVYPQETDCLPASASHTFITNQIRCRVGPSGYLFEPDSLGPYRVIPPGGRTPIRSFQQMGLWLGGLNPGYNVKVNTLPANPAQGVYGYRPGPLYPGDADYPGGQLSDPARGSTSPDICHNWDQVWKMSRREVLNFLADWRDDQYLQRPHRAIMAWPAAGNPRFAEIHGFELPNDRETLLAPFYDQNLNGRYEPLEGDYPCVPNRNHCGDPYSFPDQFTWMIYHTAQREDAYLPAIEIQQMTWAYQCPDDPLLDNTIFMQLRFKNLGLEDLDSLYIGISQTPSLGCPEDDYMGCIPETNTYYFYNASPKDGDTQGCANEQIAGFGAQQPIQAVTFMRSITDYEFATFTYWSDSLMARHNSFGPPTDLWAYYRVLSGTSRAGIPYTTGGDGYHPDSTTQTTLLFPDLPTDPNGWSMATAQLPTDQKQVMGAVWCGRRSRGRSWALTPNSHFGVNLAFSTHFKPPHLSKAAHFEQFYLATQELEWALAGVLHRPSLDCGVLTQSADGTPADLTPLLYPNPVSNQLTARTPRPIIRYTLLNPAGVVIHQRSGYWSNMLRIPVSKLAAGMYLLRMETATGQVYTSKWVKQ